MTTPNTCESCRFWNPAWRFKKHGGSGAPADAAPLDLSRPHASAARKKSDRGQCRRYAPRASALTTIWMETRPWDWCGEHEPAEESA